MNRSSWDQNEGTGWFLRRDRLHRRGFVASASRHGAAGDARRQALGGPNSEIAGAGYIAFSSRRAKGRDRVPSLSGPPFPSRARAHLDPFQVAAHSRLLDLQLVPDAVDDDVSWSDRHYLVIGGFLAR